MKKDFKKLVAKNNSSTSNQNQFLKKITDIFGLNKNLKSPENPGNFGTHNLEKKLSPFSKAFSKVNSQNNPKIIPKSNSKSQTNIQLKKSSKFENLNSKNSSSSAPKSFISSFILFLLSFFKAILGILALPFLFVFGILNKFFIQRDLVIKSVFSLVFLSLVLQFYNLQVLNQEIGADSKLRNLALTFPQRGQIFVQDLSFNRNNRPLTSSIYTSKATFNPATLKTMIQNNITTEQKASTAISSALNIPLDEVSKIIKSSINKDKPSKYAVLYENLNQTQTQTLKSLLLSNKYTSDEFVSQNFVNWLNVEDTEVRTYPEGNFLSPSIGYMREKPAPAAEVESLPGCQNMIERNKERQTDYIQYKMPSGGLEQRFCSELSGLNGRDLSNAEINSGTKSLQAVNGADVYLTIDYNIQRKAEEVLDRMMRDSSNEKGAPKDGVIIVVEANNPTDPSKNGRILAMANAPRFDPNKYSEEFTKKPESFRNAATSGDFEIGSVMKPMTVAMALNEYFDAKAENDQKVQKKSCPTGDRPLELAQQKPDLYDLRLCVSPTWAFNDYPNGTKEFTEINGKVNKVSNFNKNYFGNNQSLSNVIRDSINTGISDIMDNQNRDNVKEYFVNRFKFGKPTLLNLPGDTSGDVRPFKKEDGIRIQNTFFGFGQGFTASPLQVVRAYMPILQEGKMIEPFIVDKIEYTNQIVDKGDTEGSNIYKPKPEQVIRPEVAQLVKSYMVNTSQQGYRGNGVSISLNGYSNGSKTGTAQIGRWVDVKDENGNVIVETNGENRRVLCDYDCFSGKGLTNHSFVGFAPESKPRVLVFLKMSEPLPGDTQVTSLVTMREPYKEILQYSLEHLKVPKDK